MAQSESVSEQDDWKSRGRVWYRLALGMLVGAIVCFVASLALPCYDLGKDDGPVGLVLLLLGWMGTLCRELAWWANPCLFMSMAIMGRRLSLPFSRTDVSKLIRESFDFLVIEFFGVLFGLILALTFAFQSTTKMGPGPAGTDWKIVSLEAGYYFWISSFLLLFCTQVASLIWMRRVRASAE